MITLKLTKEDFNEDKEYIGKEDLSNFYGNLEIAAGLGALYFKSIKTTGYIHSKAGSSIAAWLGIESGLDIVIGLGIRAGWSVKAVLDIRTGWSVEARSDIEAGGRIKAGLGIEAGGSIDSGDSISAGWGVNAGKHITCKTGLQAHLRIFAGLCLGQIPNEDELKITCGKLERGVIAYGTLIETGQ